MKLKNQIFVSLVPLLLVAGCASHDDVYFASTVKVPPPPDTPSQARHLSKTDDKQIQMLAYDRLLEQKAWEGGNYFALFLQADDDVVAAFIQKYPNHVPPIKPSQNIDLRSSQSPTDKATGKPVMILGADIGEPNAEGVVQVTGRWFAGTAAQGTNEFALKKTGDNWTVLTDQ